MSDQLTIELGLIDEILQEIMTLASQYEYRANIRYWSEGGDSAEASKFMDRKFALLQAYALVYHKREAHAPTPS